MLLVITTSDKIMLVIMTIIRIRIMILIIVIRKHENYDQDIIMIL